ncbi:DUF3147 family protein [Actinoplanes awajinensis]|uniref:DUF3147 family protein n=1 Tax=Actinoplanes awajinensis subsp. mycoplanecinus TaxID=135947 RepID=A0A101JEI6_9ACTN|nr:DUF3147 family protein [Actinoplanes awajinensis]KUL25298.1 hypothetical protein ADL15_40965 [Actinoplanes awajinensis subsp. mycoplanecinus]
MTHTEAARPPEASPAEVAKTPAREWFVRFAFGAGVSALAGISSEVWGPKVGGLFLAFPAILLASLTLVAKDEGAHQAREDARGAALGAAGLIGFALVVATTARHWPVWLTLVTATLAWLSISGTAYLITAVLHRTREN